MFMLIINIVITSEELMTRSVVNSDGFGIKYVVTIK
jgi:hypothetical protein